MTNKPLEMRIVHLVDAPEAVPVLVRWLIEEWMPWYGPGGEGDAEADLRACRSRDALPICLIARDKEDDGVLGTAALKTESVGSELGVGPWLAAFLVGKDVRRRGVGTALVAAIEQEAARLAFTEIYTSTDAAISGLLRRRGWQAFGESESLRGPVGIYRCEIGRAPG